LVLALVPWDGGLAALRWDRAAIAQGQAWRALSGQLVHLWPGHALLNAAALAVGMALFREFRNRDWGAALLVSALAVAAGLWWLSPQVAWYAGLSGALHGVFAGGALRWIRRREPGGVLLAAGLLLKLGWETLSGPAALSEWLTGGPVLTAVHLYGAVGGLIWGLAGPPGPAGYNVGPAAPDPARRRGR
jgi:rhomboid family GlyGly-CTERM serine protease